jgi:hypothetical protein
LCSSTVSLLTWTLVAYSMSLHRYWQSIACLVLLCGSLVRPFKEGALPFLKIGPLVSEPSPFLA